MHFAGPVRTRAKPFFPKFEKGSALCLVSKFNTTRGANIEILRRMLEQESADRTHISAI
jgi:hypothetical protein